MSKAVSKEGKLIIRPVGRLGGLDYLHVSLLVLVAILIGIILEVSSSKPVIITASNSSPNATCRYFYSGSCIVPKYNASYALLQAERLIASYIYTNTSLSILPFYSRTSSASEYFVPTANAWIIEMPVRYSNSSFTFLVVVNSSTGNVENAYEEAASPSKILENYVSANGIIVLANKPACSVAYPVQQYWFIDPYAPGSLRSLSYLFNETKKLGVKVNPSLKLVFGYYSQNIASTYGLNNSLALSEYLFCASLQNSSSFHSFVNSLSNLSGFISPYLLSSYANKYLNTKELSSCLYNASQPLSAQSLLASYYNISAPIEVITDCRYLSLPNGAYNATCFANSSVCPNT
ncbi:MAG: hypothetical protein QXL16_00050 [Candidatus Micrarchaeaceae archaeon]